MKITLDRAAIIATAAVVMIVLAAALVSIRQPSTDIQVPTSIAKELWMHSEQPAYSDGDRWYNFTLTLNESLPFADIFFLFVNQEHDTVDPPGNFSLTVMNGNHALAEFNISMGVWTTGGSGVLASGDWLDVQVYDQDLDGDELVAAGAGPFSSVSPVVFP